MADAFTATHSRRGAVVTCSQPGEDSLTAASLGESSALSAEATSFYARTLPDSYRTANDPDRIASDLVRVDRLIPNGVDAHFYFTGSWRGGSRLVIHVASVPVALSAMMPILHSIGFTVIDELPHRIDRPDGMQTWLYDFGVSLRDSFGGCPEEQPVEEVSERVRQTVLAIWRGDAEVDAFNALVLRAELTWQEVNVLRIYARYLQQVSFPHGLDRIASVLAEHPAAGQIFLALFVARFDPDAVDEAAAEQHVADLRTMIDEAGTLEADRVLRALLALVLSTVRTNYYRCSSTSSPRSPAIAIKLTTQELPFVVHPKPQFEVFVSSPTTEGVHLRFGRVARGGVRWSDRADDFRTEILGLVKAQAVKNAVIVPVGAKGGFVVRRASSRTHDVRTGGNPMQLQGLESYREFVGALLDVTDNVTADGVVVPPRGVVRHDGDDPYLVVAADKGTATLSDEANALADRYGHWLGDAFASGGSVGYDHKSMAITAKGAWESVRRHFGELGINPAIDTFTAIGIGDMSGDVFGNGMLLSEQIKLIAAFDHRHIFLDPEPDSSRSFRERQRLFGLSRSSWADYDSTVLSSGGGVYARTAKSIALNASVRRALGIAEDVQQMSPDDLIAAVLRAPVDLLWNGGIGTYIKASDESDLEVGDKTNDGVRVAATEVRAKVIGEGGNLGVSPRGRIEFAARGGAINTDALDNSAGVDCSDHEVNIKILLASVIADGSLRRDERNQILKSMTAEVEQLVLAHNVAHNALLGRCRATAAQHIRLHGRQLRALETHYGLNRALDVLPSDGEIDRRVKHGMGLTSPELAVLLAHTKSALKTDLLASALPDSDVFLDRLMSYFPAELGRRFPDAIRSHRLRREIVATILTNEVVDTGGVSYVFRLMEDTGCDSADAVRAYIVTAQIFELPVLMDRIGRSTAATSVGDQMIAEVRQLLYRSARWLLSHLPQPIAVGAEIRRFGDQARTLLSSIPALLTGQDAASVDRRVRELIDLGVDRDLAQSIATLLNCFYVLDIIEIADLERRPVDRASRLFYALSAHLGIDQVLTAVSELDEAERWDALAKTTLREDIYDALRALCRDALGWTTDEQSITEMITDWERSNIARLGRTRTILSEMADRGVYDVKVLSVAARQLRTMVIKADHGRGPSHLQA